MQMSNPQNGQDLEFLSNYTKCQEPTENTKNNGQQKQQRNKMELGAFDQTAFDASFEAIERMCNKTASDPNSTLFQYLHNNRKGKVETGTKKREQEPQSIEFEAGTPGIGNLFHNMKLYDQEDLNKTSAIMNIDCTQLEDIEAPSRFWDNTMTSSYEATQISPVKMLKLLRPSTILECEEDVSTSSSADASSTSYQSAAKSVRSETAASSYDTANDNSVGTNSGVDITSTKASEVNTFTQCKHKIDIIETVCLEDESIVEVASEDDTDTDNDNVEKAASKIKNVKQESKLLDFSDLEIDDPIDFDAELQFAPDANKENVNVNKSLQLNDTMEEVKEIMRKGLEMLASASSEHKEAPTATPSTPAKSKENLNFTLKKQNTFIISSPNFIQFDTPKQKPFLESNINTSSKLYAASDKKIDPVVISPKKIPLNIAKTPKTPKSFEIEMKIRSRSKFFEPPSAIPTMRKKELKQSYSHVISPIRTYMQKTATTPLMASMKSKNTNTDVMNSTAFRELENESRLCQPKFGTTGTKLNVNRVSAVKTYSSLPKKAYISSEYKHIVDERTPVTIPGGKKVQKVLESAMVPNILRHDGKFKVPGGLKSDVKLKDSGTAVNKSATTSHIPRRHDGSLANLSVMSGDVSMYTMKDAQKF